MDDKEQAAPQDVRASASGSVGGSSRIEPKVEVTAGTVVQVEFRIEDLVRRLMPGIGMSHCAGCWGCSGCSH
jgi:hypothetical protein